MVFFSCNACGESLKKASVEKHYLTQCRACEVLSCLDCGKDFYGDAYRDHNSCISEDQKYGGKNYKPVVQKGQVKQTGWMGTVREASMSPSLNPKVKNVLDRIISGGHENIPRKKAKFANFLGSSLHLWDQKLIDQVWNVISAHASTQKPNNAPQSSVQEVPKQEKESTQPSENKTTNEIEKEQEEGEQRDKEKMTKKKKKHKEKSTDEKDEEEAVGRRKRKRQGDPLEVGEGEIEMEEAVKSKKKKKKRREEMNGNVENINESAVENSSGPDGIGEWVNESNSEMSAETENGNNYKEKKRKKKKGKVNEEINGQDTIEEEDAGIDDDIPENEVSRKGEKFPWDIVITEILEKADGEIRLKKLKKKVLSEFHSRGGDPSITSEEKLLSKFNKKVTKNPKLKTHKDMVKLKH